MAWPARLNRENYNLSTSFLIWTSFLIVLVTTDDKTPLVLDQSKHNVTVISIHLYMKPLSAVINSVSCYRIFYCPGSCSLPPLS